MQASVVRQLRQRLLSTMMAINGRAHDGLDRVEINVDCGDSFEMWREVRTGSSYLDGRGEHSVRWARRGSGHHEADARWTLSYPWQR